MKGGRRWSPAPVVETVVRAPSARHVWTLGSTGGTDAAIAGSKVVTSFGRVITRHGCLDTGRMPAEAGTGSAGTGADPPPISHPAPLDAAKIHAIAVESSGSCCLRVSPQRPRGVCRLMGSGAAAALCRSAARWSCTDRSSDAASASAAPARCLPTAGDALLHGCRSAAPPGGRSRRIEGLGTPDSPDARAGGVHRRTGGAVRLLHQRNDRGGRGAVAPARPGPRRAGQAGALAGNLCRCGTHTRILRAVMRAAQA